MSTRELVAGPAADLADTVADLIGPRRGTVEVDTEGGASALRSVVRASRYVELRDAVVGQQGSGHGGVARSLPPVWVDVLDLLRQVDDEVARWAADYSLDDHPDGGSRPEPVTVRRLRALTAVSWSPEHVELVGWLADTLARWRRSADTLLDGDEHRRLEVVAPCPACAVRTVYRIDACGERVRAAALELSVLGCRCQACGQVWPPSHLSLLAEVLTT